MNLDKRLLHLVKDSRLFLVLTIGLGLLAGVFTVVQAGLLSQVIGKVFLEEETLAEVTGLLEFLLIAITIRAVTVWGSEVSASTLAIRIKTSLRRQLFKHILKLGPTYARAERTGELTSVLVEGIEALETYFSQYLPGLV
ncbi:MAG: ABC transporter transmembrane domain-containing protein, partial [Anaerolineales bacterium]